MFVEVTLLIILSPIHEYLFTLLLESTLVCLSGGVYV